MGIVPFFKRGDIGGLTYLVTNNIVNYLIVIATLSGVLKWPDKVVFGYVIPGMSIGLFLGCCYYAWMGYRISKRDQRPDVTALPSGVSTTAADTESCAAWYGCGNRIHLDGNRRCI